MWQHFRNPICLPSIYEVWYYLESQNVANLLWSTKQNSLQKLLKTATTLYFSAFYFLLIKWLRLWYMHYEPKATICMRPFYWMVLLSANLLMLNLFVYRVTFLWYFSSQIYDFVLPQIPLPKSKVPFSLRMWAYNSFVLPQIWVQKSKFHCLWYDISLLTSGKFRFAF